MSVKYPHIEPALWPLVEPVAGLVEDGQNARKHGERNMDAVKGSLKGFRQQKPIVVDGDGKVIAGNCTLRAAVALGWEHIAVVRTTLTGAESRAFAIADNRTAELAEWEVGTLAEALAGLQCDEGIDHLLTGYTEVEIEGMTGTYAASEATMPALASGDKAPFQQMTFTLHDDQAELVKRAMQAAKDAGPFVDTGNENSNGNALARIAEAYIGQG